MSGTGRRVRGRESALRIENEMLLERVRVLEASLREPVHAPPSWRLTPSQHTILGVMLARDVADRDALYLFCDEREALVRFWDTRERNRPAVNAVAARLNARKRRSSSSLPVREV